MARLVTLEEWAKNEFGHPIPGKALLHKFARNGMIAPPARKVGQKWRVECNARFVGLDKPLIKESDSPILKRILDDG